MATASENVNQRVPTVDDLRIKLCYICREEETYDQPQSPPRRWVHPCRCSLIAHESCLLQWIRTAETNPSRSQDTVLKCPQCGTKYELDSKHPLILRIMEASNVVLSGCGRAITVMSFGAIVITFGAGIYTLSTGYGAFAIRQFVGNEMYQMLLTDDPTNWPFHAWINVPLIPFSLIFGQTSMFRNAIPLYSIFFLWPTVPPLVPPTSTNPTVLPRFNISSASYASTTLPTFRDILLSWPPSPLMMTILVPIVRVVYRRCFTAFRHWLLGTRPAPPNGRGPRPNVRRLMFENWQMEMRIQGDPLDDVPPPAPPLPIDDDRPADVNEAAAADEAQNEDGAPAAPVAAAAAGAAPAPPAAQDRDGVTIRMTGASLGRLIGGALLLPSIANIMGGLLFRLSKHSEIIRRVLAVRPHNLAFISSGPGLNWERMSLLQRMRMGLRLGISVTGAGSPAWRKADPVWWRNSLGLGLWLVARDCMDLWYLWLSQREIRSRRLKSRSFEDVDRAELDLITGH